MSYGETNGYSQGGTIVAGLRKSMDEERFAANVYRERANAALEEGDIVSADLWRHIAHEEVHHWGELRKRLNELAYGDELHGPAESDWLQRESGKSKHRPMPSNYGEWVELAEDIKRALPVFEWSTVNACLQSIATDDASSEESKRWLTRRAHELNVD